MADPEAAVKWSDHPLLVGCGKTRQQKHKKEQGSATCHGAGLLPATSGCKLHQLSSDNKNCIILHARCYFCSFFCSGFWALYFLIMTHLREKSNNVLFLPVFYSPSFLSFHHAAIFPFLHASCSIKLTILSPKSVFLLTLSVLFILTHLFSPSNLFLSVSFPPSLARSSFSQFMQEFALQRLSALHICKAHRRTEVIAKAPLLLW